MTAAQIIKLSFFVSACKRLGVDCTKRQARKAKQGAGKWKGSQITATLTNINLVAGRMAA